jgi:hypothetical protein
LPSARHDCLRAWRPDLWLVGHPGIPRDVAGAAWRAQDLRETTVVVMLSTMLFTAALALSRWAARQSAAPS